MASHVNILKYGVSSPADTSPLKHLQAAGYDPSSILAVIGKSEGNGCVNDFSRTLSTHVWEPLIPESAVTIFSGGTEGVLSPHVTFIVREQEATGLQAAAGRTRTLEPHEIGTTEQALQVASSVREILDRTNISRENVHLVLIKCPLLTSETIEITKAASKPPVTTDTYESMARSRYASALGIAVALGELQENYLDEAMRDQTTWSTKASCSSGAELEDCHILILASNPSSGNVRAVSTHMDDAIDAGSILKILDQVRNEQGHVLQVFAKAEADPNNKIRGMRHTMNNDSDIHSTRHARAAVGGLLAGLFGDTQLYVSGKYICIYLNSIQTSAYRKNLIQEGQRDKALLEVEA
ncbi:Cyanuric acid amidohydrolase [Lachnellula occidentalis]|uniref:Cyanuric acid amidohydrolase n=1 Tax=Lachnellula occidentalis TaxID=215460 RepID=A0A8H8RMJ9_9HELO|nr:Cyanuric acid amidohydrolase [Lachnellula occidentalis]